MKGSAVRIRASALLDLQGFSAMCRLFWRQPKTVGFGDAALWIDATIIGCVLAPASMKLLGDWNWYLRSWLAWLPDPHVEHEPT
jgi:putative drug exporter of the RND superfamily